MPLTGMNPPIVVDNPQLYQQMLEALSTEAVIAVDTESNSLHAYQERICLIQLSSRQKDYLLDPFAFSELKALGDLFANPAIQKVFHAGDYDLTCLKRDYHFEFNNLFDTMLAANALGETTLGLAGLLKKHLGVEIEKKYQRADWGKRPIKPEMLQYAQADSHYLIPLMEILTPLLIQQNRLQLVLEDSAALASQTQAMKTNGEDLRRVRGTRGLKPQTLSLLMELNAMREGIAKERDLPPFKILSDRALVEAAEMQPKYLEELGLLPSFSAGQVKRYGRKILQTVAAWRKDPRSVHRQPSAILPEDVLRRRDLLAEWRKKKGSRLGVSSNVILTRELLESIADKPIRNLQELERAMQSSPTRFSQYGLELIDLLRKEEG